MSAPRTGARPVTDIRWLSGVMSSRPLPTPAAAVTIGSAIANSDPNATSRMTAAAAMPIADAIDVGAVSVLEMAQPASSTSRAGSRAAIATAITCLTSALSRSSAALPKFTVAYAVRPSGLIWTSPPGRYGLATEATSGRCDTRVSIADIRCSMTGSLTLPRCTCQTIWSESPAWAGADRSSSSCALPEPVPGTVSELSYDVFTACDITTRPMSRPIQAAITTNRCR